MMTLQTRGAGRRRDDNRSCLAPRTAPEAATPTSAQLRALAAHQQLMLERERQRIAQEIHDELGGTLSGIRSCIAVVLRRASQARQQPDPLLEDACALASEAMESAHRIAMDLRPGVIDQLGIWASLEWYAGRMARHSGLLCECSMERMPANMEIDNKRELAIFRIVQEALTNVERHAHAKHISLGAACRANMLTVTIADDGVGCEPQHEFREGAMGWFGMVERARQEHGTLTINSQPGQGTVLVLSLPIGERDHG